MPKTSLASERVEAFVRSRFSDVAEFAPMVEGEVSQAFSFEAGGLARVIRVGSSLRGFHLDRYAAERFASSELPIPAVLDVGWLDPGHAFCVSVKAPGRTLQDIGPDQARLLREPLTELWRALGRADISDTTGYGHFDERGHASAAGWREFLRAALADARCEHSSTAGRIDPQLHRELLGVFESLIERCPEERRLVHGDFGSNNVLADGDAVTALIDWDSAMYGDPLYDIATAHFWRPWLGCMRIADDYWQAELAAMPGFRARTRCYAVHVGLCELYAHTVVGEEWMLRWLHRRCRKLVSQWRH